MPQKLRNRLKLGLWVILPFLLHSFISNGLSDNSPNIEAGTCHFTSIGALNTELQGKATFTQDEVISENGHLIATLRLDFMTGKESTESPIQFLISVDANKEAITTGTYNISRYISGFIDNFDGVFGYANLSTLGETPLFTRKGQLVITDKSADAIAGTLDVILEDVQGKALHLKGNFSALGN